MPDSAKLPCHANPWQLDHDHGTNQTNCPLPPAPHCRIQRQGLRPATGMRGAASIVRPRGFRVCLLVFGLPRACTFQVHPDIKSKTNNATAVPSIKAGVAAVAFVAGTRRGTFGCTGSHMHWPEGHSRLSINGLSCVIASRVVGASSSSQSQRMETS